VNDFDGGRLAEEAETEIQQAPIGLDLAGIDAAAAAARER